MAWEEECYETGDFVLSGFTSTCRQSCATRAHICQAHVQRSSEGAGVRLLYQAESRVSVRPIHWWHTFLKNWNGISFLHPGKYMHPQATIHTDASGHWGCGAVFNTLWFQLQWPKQWLPVAIMVKELVPIVLACAAWGPMLTSQTVHFQCDNTRMVAAIQKGTSKEQHAMHLLRCLCFFLQRIMT